MSRPPFGQCPARGPGLSHIQDAERRPDGSCLYCGCPYDFAKAKWGPAMDGPTNVSPELRREYAQIRKEGLSDQDAQAFVAYLHGLPTAEDQRDPWTLEELDGLMKTKKVHNLLG